MAVSKKGSRRITVEGVPYRWWLTGKTRFRGNAFGDCYLRISPETGGTTLLVELRDRRYPEGEADADIEASSKNALTPKDVEKIIRLGLLMEEGSPLDRLLNRQFGLDGCYYVSAVELAFKPEFVGKFPASRKA
jgi:hypothetical protein